MKLVNCPNCGALIKHGQSYCNVCDELTGWEAKIEMEKQKLSSEELEKAAKPLVDILYKYYNPHTIIIIDQTSVEILSGEMALPIKPRD